MCSRVYNVGVVGVECIVVVVVECVVRVVVKDNTSTLISLRVLSI